MMKRKNLMFIWMLAVPLVMFAAGVKAEAATSGEWEYEKKDDSSVIVQKYLGSNSEISVPETLDGMTVVGIGDEAFSDQDTLKKINLPDTITEIGWYAFSELDNLKELVIPKGVTTIQEGLFYKSTGIEKIVLPETIETIEGDAFSECSNLKEVNLPSNIETIGSSVFSDCYSLKSIQLPETMTKIPYGMFARCSSLENINIPDSVTVIDSFAFYKCSSLPEITLPDGLTIIDSGAFSGCSSLVTIEIPVKVNTIGGETGDYSSVFSECFSLESIEVEDNNNYFSDIDGVLFNKDKTELFLYPAGKNGETYGIPEGVKEVYSSAFADCSNLVTLTMSASVQKISTGMISGSKKLEEIIVEENNEVYASVDGILYDKEKKTLLRCPEGKMEIHSFPAEVGQIGARAFSNTSIKDVVLPKGIISISNQAFQDSELSSITLPEGLTEIGDRAFLACKNLNQITIPKSVTQIGFCAIGYMTYSIDANNAEKNPNIIIHGYSGSATERYTKEYGFAFVSLDKPADDGKQPENPYTPTKPQTGGTAAVNKGVAAPVKASSLRITGLSNKIAAGKKVQLTVTFAPANTANKGVIWTSSNPKVATVNQNGVVSFKKKAAGKSVIITATATDGSGAKAVFKVKSMKGVVKKVTIPGAKNRTVKAGKALKLKAKVTATKGANKKLKWTSSNTKYATVSASGKVKTKKAGKGKKVKITAMATDGSGKKQVVKVKIK